MVLDNYKFGFISTLYQYFFAIQFAIASKRSLNAWYN